MKLSVKTYIGIGVIMLVIATVVVLMVYILIQQQLRSQTVVSESGTAVTTGIEAQQSSRVITSVSQASTTSAPVSTEPQTGIPLRTVPLSREQQAALIDTGIDIETYVITTETQQCARKILGSGRFEAIIAGDVPTTAEGFALFACL